MWECISLDGDARDLRRTISMFDPRLCFKYVKYKLCEMCVWGGGEMYPEFFVHYIPICLDLDMSLWSQMLAEADHN